MSNIVFHIGDIRNVYDDAYIDYHHADLCNAFVIVCAPSCSLRQLVPNWNQRSKRVKSLRTFSDPDQVLE